MSWVRTATALIGFGFTIFQFLHRFNQTPGIKPAVEPWTPWVLSLSLIGTGIVALTIAVGSTGCWFAISGRRISNRLPGLMNLLTTHRSSRYQSS